MAVLASLCACALVASVPQMAVDFDASNTLKSICVDGAAFATGGGDLWTAKFAVGGIWTNLTTVAAHEGDALAKRQIRNWWRSCGIISPEIC